MTTTAETKMGTTIAKLNALLAELTNEAWENDRRHHQQVDRGASDEGGYHMGARDALRNVTGRLAPLLADLARSQEVR